MGAGATAPLWGGVVAGPFFKQSGSDHFVPADKKLSPEWVAGLYALGKATWHTGADLETIGMPIGGIAVGQAYLLGTGQIALWDIWNREYNTGYGGANYPKRRKALDLVVVGQTPLQPPLVSLTLNGEPLVAEGFLGEYPRAWVRYKAPQGLTIEAVFRAPFVPLDASASAVPGCMVTVRVGNTGTERLEAVIGIVADTSRFPRAPGTEAFRRRTSRDGVSCLTVGLEPLPTPEAQPVDVPVVFADFEADGYPGWTVEGEAFGKGPARGTLPNQQRVSGFDGDRLVNSFLGGDDRLQGRMLSREFTIEKPWISLLVGGGSERVGVRLLVADKEVAHAAGKNLERLEVVNWDVAAHKGSKARIEIYDANSGGWGHINVDQIEFRERPRPEPSVPPALRPEVGDFTLATDGDETDPNAVMVTVETGSNAEVRFAAAWRYPNLYRDDQRVGRVYESNSSSSAEFATSLLRNPSRIGAGEAWVQAFYDSTLPRWLLDRVGSTVSILATNTCQWWKNGRFWGWEGVGCCHGTCGHVWNYAQAMARLFPELERSVRSMQDFAEGVGLQENGAIGFRGEGWSLWAGDSQGGYILKAYREHLISEDDKFLRDVWPRVKRATRFLIEQDANGDGIIEGRQHQTYDQDYFGANTFVGSLYLGALRAAEAMATLMGDNAFASECRTLFEQGRDATMKRLFNGEYFIQDVDLKQHPDWQYGDGCLADQLFGQMWAHEVGLGHLYPEDAVKTAMSSVWKYNWAPDIAAQNAAHKPERWFAHPGEAGLFTCTWPKSKHLGEKSTRYRDEIWTGIEYQVAAHMIREGLVEEGLAICRAIHERYDASKRNPWNEIECGDHYARALASWSVLTALAGFHCDGPRGVFAFDPKLTPEDFRSVFTGPAGWGVYRQRRAASTQLATVTLSRGRLRVTELRIGCPPGAKPVEVTLNGARIEAKSRIEHGPAVFAFDAKVLAPGDELEAEVRLG